VFYLFIYYFKAKVKVEGEAHVSKLKLRVCIYKKTISKVQALLTKQRPRKGKRALPVLLQDHIPE
jgi:uncharacterized protein with FMN-binding domain